MDMQASNHASLAKLLEAERAARPLPADALLRRLQISMRFQPARRQEYVSLSLAAQTTMQEDRRSVPDVRLAGKAGGVTPAETGPVLLVCESQPFAPILHRQQDQMLLRLLAGLEQTGATGWIVRTPRTRVRPLIWLLRNLPARPAAIIAVGISHPPSLQTLQQVAPVVRLGTRSASIRAIACVEHDAWLEAHKIASYAAGHKAEQIAFVAGIDRLAGKRRIDGGDFGVLSVLVAESHNRHIAVPGHLTFWVDQQQTLKEAGILPRIIRQATSHVVLVVSNPAWAGEVAAVLAGREGVRVICRHWSAEESAGVPTIGPDLDQLARVVLARLPGRDNLPSDTAMLVAPTWHRRP